MATSADEDAQVIVALGGDGFMLETLHDTLQRQTPIYGMNRGSVGFLMNEYDEDDLLERINAAERAVIHPLAMEAIDADGKQHQALAINEVSLLRQTRQTAKLRIWHRRQGADGASWSATARWSPRRPARPPTTCRPTARSSRSAPRCWP